MKRQSIRGKLKDITSISTVMTLTSPEPPAPIESVVSVIRPAEERDIVEIITLLASAGRPMPKADQVVAVADIYREMIGLESCLARVADQDGTVLGVLLGTLRPRANWLTPELWISDLAVDVNAAEKIVESLLEEALRVADAWGCFRVVVDATDEVKPFRDLFKAAGFSTSGGLLAYAPTDTRAADHASGVPIVYRDSNI